jgi:Cytochrome C'
MRTARLLAAGALALLAGCQPSTPASSTAAATAPPPLLPRPQASTIALMTGVIAPTSDAIWQAMPASDKDWAELRYKVLLMAEAANLLAVPDRPGLLPGEKLASPAGPGDLPPEKSAEKIKAEWATYLAYAQTLQNGAMATLKAVDAKDADALVEAGGAIYEACEQCHKRFWYPDAPAAP